MVIVVLLPNGLFQTTCLNRDVILRNTMARKITLNSRSHPRALRYVDKVTSTARPVII